MKERTRAVLRERLFGVEPEPIGMGRFILLESVGSGAMGTVYAARDPELDRKVAVKVIRPDLSRSDVSRRRLLREARAMAKLSHPNVVSVYDVGTVDETVFFAMELIDGATLREWLAAEPHSWREIVGAFVQAGRGLEAAHDAGLIHRDFKPDNVLVRKSGRVQVMDFGVASVSDVDETGEWPDAEPGADRLLSLTRTGGVIGTPRYMAPEQHVSGRVDPRTDQFSFCVALWEALYGEAPFAGGTLAELADQVLEGTLREPSSERGVPRWVRKLLERGLQPDRERRFASMTELLTELTRDPGRRKRVAAVAIACAAAIGIGVFGMARVRGVAACTGAAGKLAGVWDDERRAAMAGAFGKSKLRVAGDIARRAARNLDRYANEWAAMHEAACEAGRRKEHSTHILDLRMACLEDRRVHLRALTDLLAKADEDVIEKSLQSIAALPDVDRCADLRALTRAVPLPESAADRRRLESLQPELAAARALLLAGKYEPGLAAARALFAETKGFSYAPLVADVELMLASLLDASGSYDEAEKHARAAYFRALAARHDQTAAEAARALVSIIGVHKERYEKGLMWVEHAEAVVRRIDPGGVLAAKLAAARGDLYERSGKNEEAEASFRRAVDMSQAGKNRALLAHALLGLGHVLEARAKFGEAYRTHQRAVAVIEGELGTDHPTTLMTHAGMARSMATAGDLRGAGKLMERVLLGAERAFGKAHPNTAKITNNLGVIEYRRGNYTRALELFRRTLAIGEARLGKEHPGNATTLDNVGLVLKAMGRPQEALQAYRRAEAIERKHMAPGHPNFVKHKTSISSLYVALHRLQDAQREAEAAHKIAIEFHGADHPLAGQALVELGNVHLHRRSFEKARACFEQVLAIWSKAYGLGSERVAHAYAQLGRAYANLRKFEQAAKHYRRALDIFTKKLGTNHPHVAAVLSNTGELYLDWRKPREALAHFQRSMAVESKAIGADHPVRARAQVGLGNAYLQLEQPGRAAEAARRAVAIRSNDPALLGAAQFVLAQALWRLGKRREAIRLGRAARDNHRKAKEPASKLEAWLAKHDR